MRAPQDLDSMKGKSKVGERQIKKKKKKLERNREIKRERER